ncbi:hypothetical protein [Microbulbifer sp. S227A]|uniref:hypothetical protein n=1 Tax=Microbulbifer sp. S227A TaxID=3415131 RepID=UPI003C7E60FF
MNTAPIRKKELEDKIADLEATLSELKRQLEAETESEQHAAIDRLEEYLGDLDNKHANLQDFWKMLRSDIKNLFSAQAARGGDQ